ncbi:MAG: shikimate kinase AroK [Pseudomonadales bacterium]|jgi:shikimate kinase|nr:shikimate kinase AroK [Pseudomonadales bacterium]
MLPASTHNIFLIGPMGAGKTTIGRLLAEGLGRAFYDSDQVIEERAGANIPWIFDVEGELGFRARESSVICDLCALDNIVMATGGGAILAEQNRRCLQQRGVVVYLMATVSQQVERTKRDQRRPLLKNVADPRVKLADLMEIREPLYRQIADISLMTSRRSPRAVATEILDLLRQSGATL